MPLIYKPFRQSMHPSNEPIAPTNSNIFSVNMNGSVCTAYKFSVLTMDNTIPVGLPVSSVTLPAEWEYDRQYFIGDIAYFSPTATMYKCIKDNLSHMIWEEYVLYYAGEIVHYDVDGNYYISTVAHWSLPTLTPTDTAYWDLYTVAPIFPTNTLYWVETTDGNIYDGDTLRINVPRNTFINQILQPGTQYKWQVDMASTYMEATVTTNMGAFHVHNHNLMTGDAIYVSSTDTLPVAKSWAEYYLYPGTTYYAGDRVRYIDMPTDDYYICILNNVSGASTLPTNPTYWTLDTTTYGLDAYTKYYVRVSDVDNFYLCETIEGAKGSAGNIGCLDMRTTGTGTIKIANVATSDEVPFTVYEWFSLDPNVTTITSQSYTFAPIYVHPQGVMVNNFQAILYDSNGNIIDDSGVVYSSNLKYYFNGFLTGQTYGIKFIVVTNVGQEGSTGITPFNVVYSAPSISINATAENICQDSCIKVSWGNAVQISGAVTGGNSSYIPDYLINGDYGLSLDPSTTLTYNDVGMGADYSLPTFLWQPLSTSFDGVIAEFDNTTTGENIKIGYNNVGENFYQDRDGIIINNTPLILTTNGVYLIGISGEYLYTKLIATN